MSKMIKRGLHFLEHTFLVLFLLLSSFTPLFNVSLRALLIAITLLIVAFVILNCKRHSVINSEAGKSLARKIASMPNWQLALIIGLSAFILRLFVSLLMFRYNVQDAESNTAYINSLVQYDEQDKHQIYAPHWMYYSAYLHPFALIFGNSQLVGMIFNSIVTSASAVLVFLIANKIFQKSKLAGFCGGILFALWPSALIYISVYDPSHPTILVVLLCIFLVLCAISEPNIFKKVILFAIFGLCTGFLVLFKFTPVILIIALVVYLGFKCLIVRTKANLLNISCALLALALLVPGSLAYNSITKSITGSNPVNFTPYALMVGLGGNNYGTLWDSPELGKDWLNLLAQNSPEEASKIEYENLISSLKNRIKDLPVTLYNKNHLSTQDDVQKIEWVTITNAAQNPWLSQTIEAFVKPVNSGYYYAVIVLMILAVIAIWKRDKDIDISTVYFVLLAVSLYLAMLLVIELQERYRYIIEPLYCVIAGYGLSLFDETSLMQNKIRSRIVQT